MPDFIPVVFDDEDDDDEELQPDGSKQAVAGDNRVYDLQGRCVATEEMVKDGNAALCDEAAMERYLETGALDDGTLRGLVSARKLFPCFFGSALKSEGVEPLLDALNEYAEEKDYPMSQRKASMPLSAQKSRMSRILSQVPVWKSQ